MILTYMTTMTMQILIVDDDPINLTILEDLLSNEGYLLVTAANGTEALEVYMTTDPPVQLVLLDVTLPDMSGHEVCLKMRSLTSGVPPPIIMISGKASTKDVIKGLQAGSCDYITKPFQPQEVLARVETQLRLFTGDVGELQEQAERSMALLTQVLPPHILSSLKGGNRVLVSHPKGRTRLKCLCPNLIVVFPSRWRGLRRFVSWWPT
jgi:DNA-binding response OmpR family regulator